MDRLPNEMLDLCFNFAGPAEHIQLYWTCRLFRQVCLRYHFKSWSCRFKFDYRTTAAELEDKKSRLEKVIEGYVWVAEQHAFRVRTLNFEYSYRRPTKATDGRDDIMIQMRGVYSAFKKDFLKHLPAFTNLRTITLKFDEHSNGVPKHMLEKLCKHAGIEELCIKGGSFGYNSLSAPLRLKKFTLDNDEGLGVTGLGINRNSVSNTLFITSGERLEELCLISSIYSFKILRSLTALPAEKRCQILQSLILGDVSINDLAHFLSFLITCPTLQHLEIQEFCAYRLIPQLLAPFTAGISNSSVIPCLMSFCGPLELAAALIPGRPVETVEIVADYMHIYVAREPDTPFLVSGLALSTGPVKKLKMRYHLSPQIMQAVNPLTDLTELSLELGEERLIPDENPFQIFDVKSDFIQDNSIQRESVHGLVIHDEYMRILHWIAARRIDLPQNLERLHFHARFRPQNGEGYTFRQAIHVFEALSNRYPAFREVRASYADVSKVCWAKDRGGIWDQSLMSL